MTQTNFIESTQYLAIFTGMGTAKTATSLQRVEARGDWPLLVLGRPDDRKTWRDEMARLNLSDLPHEFHTYDSLGFAEAAPGKPLSTKQTRLRNKRRIKIAEIFDRLQPRSIIADQSECLKNRNANRTRGCIYLADLFRVRNPRASITILTAHPTPQAQLEELWAQFRFLDGGSSLGLKFWQFVHSHAYIVDDPQGHKEILWTSERRQRVLERIAHQSLFHSDVQVEKIPPLTTRTVKLNPKPWQTNLFHSMLKNYETPQEDYLNSIMAVTQAIRQFSGGLGLGNDFVPNQKADWIARAQTARKFKRAVVFASFTDEIKGLARVLKAPTLTGEQTQPQRERIRESFASGHHPIIVVQVALGKGMNELAAADAAIFTTPPWSNLMYQEAVGRINRPAGKKRNAHKLKVFNLSLLPIDETIYEAIQNRSSLNHWIKSRGWRAWKERKSK